MKRLVAIGAGAVVLAAVAIPTFADARGQGSTHAKSSGWVVCREHLALHASPALKPSPQQTHLTVADVLDSCSSSDPTIDRGIAVVTNTSPNASCATGATFTGVGRVRWNNGKTTRILEQHGSFGAGLAMAQGKITGGTEFVGASFNALDKVVIDQSITELCGSPMGLGILAADGEIQIGHVSIEGVPFGQ